MNENKENTQSLDIIGLLLLLWSKRKLIIINCLIAFVLAVVIAFSIPKKYTSKVVMAPEVSATTGAAGSLGAIASVAGVNLGSMSEGGDALYPELYPEVVSSTPFLMDVLSNEVTTVDGDTIILYDYLNKHIKTEWWVKIYSVPMAFIASLLSSEVDLTNASGPSKTYTGYLSKQQFKVLNRLKKSIVVNVDKGNYLVTLFVSMQDKNIAATVANIVSRNLTKYIEEYRSAKARADLNYSEKIHNEFKSKYIIAQNEYAEYANLHLNVVNKKNQVELLRLQNEMDMAFNLYSQASQTLEMARAKVQEVTPVCVVVEPAYVQLKASSPKKLMMAALYVFLAFFGTSAWIILKDKIIKN